jgi:DNA polymerase-1
VISVPVYSDQELTPEAAEVIGAIIDSEFPKNTFNLGSANTTAGKKVLVFGKLSPDAPIGREYVFTYSIAQIMSKPNAASVLISALKHFSAGITAVPPQLRPVRASVTMVRETFDLAQPITVDIETAGDLDIETPEQIKLLSIGFYQPGHDPHVVLYPNIYFSYGNAVRPEIADLLSQIKNPIFHNAKFDVRVLENQTGVRMKPFFDTMLAHHVLNQGAGNHKLKHLARQYLGAPEWEKDLSKYTVHGAHYENIPDDLLVEYNGWDVFWTYKLYEFLEPQINADPNAQSVFVLEMAASDFLLDVERKGFAVDMDYARQLETKMVLEVQILDHDLKAIAGQSYNPGSWQQTQAFIAGHGYVLPSTDEEHLTELKNKLAASTTHSTSSAEVTDFIDMLLEYRGVRKALKTYVQGALTKAVDGRVHSTFLIHGTTTGRLSSSGPNIQNIPRDKKYRSLYIG